MRSPGLAMCPSNGPWTILISTSCFEFKVFYVIFGLEVVFNEQVDQLDRKCSAALINNQFKQTSIFTINEELYEAHHKSINQDDSIKFIH